MDGFSMISRWPVLPAATGCLTLLGITPRDHIVGLSGIEFHADGGLHPRERGLRPWWEVAAEPGAGVRQLFQCCEGIAQHGGQTEFSRWLIESPECLHV